MSNQLEIAMTKKEIFEAVQSLQDHEQLELAHWIIEEQGTPPSLVVAPNEAELAELDRRWQNYLANPSSAVDVDTVIANARELIRRHE
jgi:L-2-hydroxyglutarate oxidase LhgO